MNLNQWRIVVFRALSVVVLTCAAFGMGVKPLFAHDSLSVTVVPPLFQLTIGAGEAWNSTLKIVNNNSYDVTYYAELMDMEASGEEGRSKFIPMVQAADEAAGQTFALARWIKLPVTSVLVHAGTSSDLPFSIEIPPTAEPGGHYAAILVGTQPGGLHATGTVLNVSSFVSSLFFVRIKGKVQESGRIREFLTSQQLYQTSNADFLLRFENLGNTHVRPQGSITIYNMWGRERGQVGINQDAEGSFGNVLPKSVRRFEFSWKGAEDLFDVGLYSAVVTLAFGEDGKQNVSSKTYFWVVPIVPVLIGLFCIALFVGSLVWFVRRYVRRALLLEQKRYGVVPISLPSTTPAPKVAVSLVGTLMEPVREGVVDLRSISKVARVATPVTIPPTIEQSPSSVGQLLGKYKLFLLFVVVLILGAVGVWVYFHTVLEPKRGFQITDVHIKAENVPAH